MSATRSGVCKPFLLLFLLFSLHLVSTSAQIPARVVSPVDNAVRVTLAGNIHPLARAQYDRGAVPGSQPITRILLLLQRGDTQEAALQTYLEQQQDKSSPNYHQWLTPAEFGAQYGPADSDVQAITQWLQSQGFTVAKVYSSKMMIEFSGTAAQVQAAFGTSIHNFEVNGKMYVANGSNPQIPAALAPVIGGIVSLNNFPRQSHVRIAGHARKIPGKPGLQPDYTFPNPFTGSGSFYGVGPADFATIYNSKNLIAAGNDGTGQTIAVVGETDINVADVQAFRQMFGLPVNFTSANVILNGEDPGITSTDEEGEADLDTQWSGAVAPGATIKFVVSASTPASQGIDLSALYIIEYNLAGVMSESYGGCESSLGVAGNAFYNSLWEQAAAQGITVALSTGDGGSAGCDDFGTEQVATLGLAVSGLASTPYNVALGGTDFDQVDKWVSFWSSTNNAVTGSSALGYVPEIPWNDNCAQIALAGCGATAPQGSLNIVAGSGGASSTYVKPKWQMGVAGMPNDNQRDIPDVSLFASGGFNQSAYIMCAGTGQINVSATCTLDPNSYQFAIVGGTSAAAPAFAGIMALVNQYQSAHGNSARQGNVNYVLYSLAKKSGASCASSATESTSCIFNDITHGNSMLPTGAPGVGTNSVPCLGGSPNCSVMVGTENGVLVEPTNSKIEAWTVGAGYDLATGLGSVNINNLTTNWGTANSVATTTTLALNPTTGITHGTAENVTVNITVSPKSGAATGDVSLIATISGPNGATTQGLDQFTLNSSGQVVNATTNSLPGGTSYQVYAHYAGDGTNAPSDSTPVTVTVGEESSQTFIVVPTFDSSGNQTNGNATSVSYGSNYFIRMYVTDKNAVGSSTGPPAPACYQENQLTCPSGTVTLTDNGNSLGTGGGGAGIYNLNVGGYTRNLSPGLLGGTHTLAASYSGDTSYLASTSATDTITVTPTSTSSSIMGGNQSIVLGSPVQLMVETSSSVYGVAPTGTMTFYDGSTPLVTITSNGYPGTPATSFASLSGIGTFTLSTGGAHSITVSYSGDSNYQGSTSAPVTIQVLYPTSMTESVSATAITFGQSVTVTATVTGFSKSPPLSGTIYFSPDNTPIQNVQTTSGTDSNGNQTMTATATTVPQGSEGIAAGYSGDPNYAIASANSPIINVNIPDFSFNPNPGSMIIPVGQTGTLQLNVVPATNLSSPVSLSCFGMQNLIQLPPASNGSLPGGYACTVQPTTVNLANGAASPVIVTLTPSVSLSPSVIKSALKSKRTIFVWLPRSRTPFWGALALSGLATLLCLGLLQRKNWPASAAVALVWLLAMMAACGGGSSGTSGGTGGGTGGGGSGGGGTAPYATTTTITTSSAKVAAGAPVTFTAKVSGQGSPTGAVYFYASGCGQIGGANLASGVATLTFTPQGPGVFSVTAVYTGDYTSNPAYSTSTSAPVTQAVTGNTTMYVGGSTGTLNRSTTVVVTLQ
jgi:hypothetical protein